MTINQENKTQAFFENTTRGKKIKEKKIKMLVEQLRLRKHCIMRRSRSYSELAPELSCCLWYPSASHIAHDQ